MLLFDRGHYPLDAQYQIFRYGNDRIHPPLIELADQLRKGAQPQFPFCWLDWNRKAMT